MRILTIIVILSLSLFTLNTLLKQNNSHQREVINGGSASHSPIPSQSQGDSLADIQHRDSTPAHREDTGRREDLGKDWISEQKRAIKNALDTQRYSQAVSLIANAYDRATSAEVNSLKSMVYQRARQLQQEQEHSQLTTLLETFLNSFSEPEAWKLAIANYRENSQWEKLLDALLQSNRLETDQSSYSSNLISMVNAASKISQDLRSSNNHIAVLNLYQNLYDEYPQYPRFQFELASAHLALQDFDQAIPLYQALVYDPELGSLANQQLDVINKAIEAKRPVAVAEPKPQRRTRRGQISVPLIRAGTSLLVDAKIEGHNSRLLLDTGASITSLSMNRIQSLGLEPTGQTVQLSTANGITTSRIYRAKKIALGRIVVNNLLVAEIDLGPNSRIDGLLGTDFLRNKNSAYSYLIDDQNNALVFTRK